jgi:hypothetical protein
VIVVVLFLAVTSFIGLVIVRQRRRWRSEVPHAAAD